MSVAADQSQHQHQHHRQRRTRLDLIFFGYFVSHIPITLLVDVVPLLPLGLTPRLMLALNAFLTEQLSDPFMVINATRSGMTWFRSLLASEMLLQLPFFFYAAHALWNGCPTRHAPLLVYGAHVSTTMIPILATLALGDIDRSFSQRLVLAGLYLPYLLIPLAITAVSFCACLRALSPAYSKVKRS
ncbi:Transmembrane protein 97 [Coemansia erecta]|uniref:Efficient mitochondria targeting-associated protein 19 n=1 Tax=Coemansia asiatica TaxID=1052880 RepID=A0A9W7XQW4_9FUNG|nr:Transmembrane protein 97 [Coemansia asiatica]KAJ2839518.1 Transmembrane protein 97 [Coemansia erecta]KAJ2859656.1 Transmembrane protein 97 [Coemansia asiatica]